MNVTKKGTIIALAGNPNVGKSTIFNALTGLKQHTGNWAGKTVTLAEGTTTYHNTEYTIVDLPGTYSLMANSKEEEIARDYICFGQADVIVVVCDGTCLERNLNLVLQTMEITRKVIVCVNLLDEALKKHIYINLKILSQKLGVPVVGTNATSKKGLNSLMKAIETVVNADVINEEPFIKYPNPIEEAISSIIPLLDEVLNPHINSNLQLSAMSLSENVISEYNINSRWIALKLIINEESIIKSINNYMGIMINDYEELSNVISETCSILSKRISKIYLDDVIVSQLLNYSHKLNKAAVITNDNHCHDRDLRIDKILTGKKTGIPIMIMLLLIIFWITLSGSNYPSQLLGTFLFWIEDCLLNFAIWINCPKWLYMPIIQGAFHVLVWVVSVMLPPMAIFFPLFTILEDLGYLPRIAFNLEHQFRKCCSCGKQALTMCMGFGCNAAGIIGCRIIDSPRERLIAIITNNFVPCNGRFPTLIAIISMFFVGNIVGIKKSILSALLLTGIILLAVMLTFLISRILSKTILKGIPSSFTLELPPYRKPQIGKVIVHSVFNRTLFVLLRAVIIAAPAGLIIWLIANVYIHDVSILSYTTNFFDPFGRLIGLDGVIIMAFILGFPANEIVIPIIIMTYLSNGYISDFNSLIELKELFILNGWTPLTAICTILFSLMHWPCSTTCLTIRKECEGSKWMLVSILVPTVTGIVVCFIVATLGRLFF